MDAAIHVKGMSKVYRNGTHALRSVDLQVPRGVCFGLLGPNGAGKSTLIKSLLGIVHPTAGSATLNGVDFRAPESRRGVGYLPEGHHFPSYLSGRGVCRYFGQLAGLKGKELEREIAEKLEWVGMASRADEKVTKFSKGMKQRVGLAQALLGSPSLVFLDEPTDGLDPIGRSEVREVIRQAVAKGTTVFFNSHLLAEVEQICDEIAILSEGRLVRQAKARDLIAEMTSDGGLRIELTTGALTDGLWTSLEERGASRTSEGFLIALEDREQVPALIDELRAAEVAIYAIQPRSGTLEDAFIQLLRPGEKSPGGEAATQKPSEPAVGSPVEEDAS